MLAVPALRIAQCSVAPWRAGARGCVTPRPAAARAARPRPPTPRYAGLCAAPGSVQRRHQRRLRQPSRRHIDGPERRPGLQRRHNAQHGGLVGAKRGTAAATDLQQPLRRGCDDGHHLIKPDRMRPAGAHAGRHPAAEGRDDEQFHRAEIVHRPFALARGNVRGRRAPSPGRPRRNGRGSRGHGDIRRAWACRPGPSVQELTALQSGAACRGSGPVGAATPPEMKRKRDSHATCTAVFTKAPDLIMISN
ncbi:MAG: hypothetical protein JWP04_3272 [Belnapia sp.]|nr:hypothetical protein [Belnapia sp.]